MRGRVQHGDSFYLRTFGCQMNEHDSERIAGMLAAQGLGRVEEPEEAGVLVYNTCSIREKADTRFLGHLGEAKRLKEADAGRTVVVAGCLAQSRRETFFEEFPFVDVLVGPQSLHELPVLLDEKREGAERQAAFLEQTERWSAELPRARRGHPHAWVQIMTGCTNFCAYCIVPHVRGPEASRPAADVESEVRRLVGEGVREVTLLGQNVNAYGAEPGFVDSDDFPALLERLAGVRGLERIRFMTSHPKDVSERLISAMAQLEPVCEHLHLPVQSGSNRILRLMGRGHDRDAYMRLVGRLREEVPGISLTTDLIVGFPSETEEDFADTLELVERCSFDSAFTFVYSPRPGTRAAELPDRVPGKTAVERMQRLVALTQERARDINRSQVGRTAEVLVEGVSRSGTEMMGRTRTHKIVNFTGGGEVGGLVPVRLEEATSTSFRGRRA